MDRRNLLSSAGLGILSIATYQPLTQLAQAASKNPSIKAICFDAFPIFDPRPIFALASSVFPENDGFTRAWFDKIFSYTWLRTSGDRYVGFYTVIEQALDFVAGRHGISITPEQRLRLMEVWLKLKPWPDVSPALDELEEMGVELAFLSNFTEEMLRTNARAGGIEDRFHYLSTDRAKAFKPAPIAYQMGIEQFGLPKQNIAFCAFAGWDAAGASWFGYPTVWVNRSRQKPENLDQETVVTGERIDTLMQFTKRRNAAPAAL